MRLQISGKLAERKGEYGKTDWVIERMAEEIIIEIKRMTKKEELGHLGTEARLLICEWTALPSISNNPDCWTRIGKKDMERLEKIQGRMIK